MLLFIPEKIKVGYNKRNDTYTGQLAYVIYQDKTGKWRKEPSWEGWRNKSITPDEFKNEPTEGFVLNKPVGGYSTGWNHRNSYIRIYDLRNFEFEITLENLLFILRETDCSRGKGLHGKFVYAWSGKDLILLPVECEDYKKSQNFTQLQGQTVKVANLIEGATYVNKHTKELIYLGRFTKYDKYQKPLKKQFIFYKDGNFVIEKSLKNISTVKCETCHPDYAELVDKYNKSEHGAAIESIYLTNIKTRPKNPEDASSGGYYGYYGFSYYHYEKINDSSYRKYYVSRGANNRYTYDKLGYCTVSLKDGVLVTSQHEREKEGLSTRYSYYSHYSYKTDIQELTDNNVYELTGKLTNGLEVKL